MFLFPLQLVVRHPEDPSFKFEWGSLYMHSGNYMKAKECFSDAVSIEQAHHPRFNSYWKKQPLLRWTGKSHRLFVSQPDDVRSPGNDVWALQGGPDPPGASHKYRARECCRLDGTGWDESLCYLSQLLRCTKKGKYRLHKHQTSVSRASNLEGQMECLLNP